MDSLIGTFLDYYNRQDFRKFQNTLAQEIYKTLGNSYSNSNEEVQMVTNMCNIIDSKTFKNLKFHATKIHGTRSFVEFYNQHKPTTKELADMVIISIATKDRKIIFEKTAFIQNKKEATKNVWKIDQDQLYLLHNFPTFKGEKGIFKRNFSREIIFNNYSETLGNYGLFQSPGEMILVNALTVFKLQQNEKISFSDIRKYAYNNIQCNSPLYTLFDYPFFNEIIYKYFKYFPKYGSPFLNLPFLNNQFVSFNIYEFIRNWSLFNIGEIVNVCGNVIDNALEKFNRILLRKAGLSNFINDDNTQEEYNYEFEDDLTIMVANLNLND